MLVTTFLLLTLLSFTAQTGAQSSVALPVLPAREVKLVPPSLPAGIAPVPNSASGQDLQVEYREGVVRIKISDIWVPVSGGCCFCPDGANKPLTWEPSKKTTDAPVKR